MSASELLELYDGVTEDLRACAGVEPRDDQTDHDAKESALLDLEEDILDRSADITLHSDQDLLYLMKIWTKAAGIEAGQEPSSSDRIVMRVFRYITDGRLAQD